jgi:hypothetical protein
VIPIDTPQTLLPGWYVPIVSERIDGKKTAKLVRIGEDIKGGIDD